MSAEGLADLDEIIDGYRNRNESPGAVVGISRRGKVVYLKAHGVAAMMMVEQGRFHPSDAVERYIPKFRDIEVAVLAEPADVDVSPEFVMKDAIPEHRLVPTRRPLTIHDLLTHTAGLGTLELGTAIASLPWLVQDQTLASWIPKLAGGPLDFQPGDRFAYSGTVGLDVVARIIEIVSGQAFNQIVTQHIFTALDMRDTHWNLPSEKISRSVVVKNDKNVWQKTNRYFSSSVGLISSARDYLHFEQMLQNRGTLFGNRLLAEESVTIMTTNQAGKVYRRKSEADGYGRAPHPCRAARHSARGAGDFCAPEQSFREDCARKLRRCGGTGAILLRSFCAHPCSRLHAHRAAKRGGV